MRRSPDDLAAVLNDLPGWADRDEISRSFPAKSARIYEGRIFSVQVETLTLPNGRDFNAEIIRHPGSVVIIPVTDSGEIILVRQYRHAIGRFAWELPAGSLKPSEDAAAAAATRVSGRNRTGAVDS